MNFYTLVSILAFCLFFYSNAVRGMDKGQWGNTDPELRQWYKTLMQPDHPTVSCCGEGDGYWADSFEQTKDGHYVAIITDSRPDEPLQRDHIEVGTKFIVPDYKIKWDQGNPTGHGVIFLKEGYQGMNIFCYVPPGGV